MITSICWNGVAVIVEVEVNVAVGVPVGPFGVSVMGSGVKEGV
jgi:hypothetical protein